MWMQYHVALYLMMDYNIKFELVTKDHKRTINSLDKVGMYILQIIPQYNFYVLQIIFQ